MRSALKKIGQEVRQRREKLSLSQEDLAGRANMDRSYLSEIENGRKNISVLVLIRLSKALKIKPHELLRHALK